MKRLLLLPFILLLSIVVPSCSDSETGNKLRRAEAVMEYSPDSAIAILHTIADPQQLGNKDKALYALLMSQAMYKNYIPVPNDSLIAIACDYYDATDDQRHRMLANFYRAGVLSDLGNYADAQPYALLTEKLSRELNDTIFMARSNEMLADNYSKSFLQDEELNHRIKCISLYKSLNKKRSELFNTMQLSGCYLQSNQYKKSERIIDSLINLIGKEEEMDGVLISSIYQTLINLQFKSNDLKNIIPTYRIAEKYSKYFEFPPQIQIYVAISYLCLDSIKVGKRLLDGINRNVLLPHELNGYYVCLAEYYKRIGKPEKAIAIHDTLYNNVNKQIREIMKQSVLKSQSEYYLSMANTELQNIENNKKVNRIWLSIAAAIILLTFLSLISIRKVKDNRIRKQMAELAILTKDIEYQITQNEQLNNEIESLKSRIDEKHTIDNDDFLNRKANNEQINIIKNELLKSRFSVINSLCENFFDSENDNKKKNEVYEEIKLISSSLKGDKFLKDALDYANSTLSQNLSELAKENSSISDSDIYYLALIHLGFGQKTIAFLLGLKLSSVYTRRRRLREKIKAINDSCNNKYNYFQTILNK